jgi:hypothetical protein
MEGWTQLWPHPRPLILRMHGLVLGPFLRMHPASSGFTLHLSRSTQLTVGREVLTKTAASFAYVRQVFHFADPQGRTHARRDGDEDADSGDEDADSRDFSAAKTGGLVLCRSPPPDLFCVWP